MQKIGEKCAYTNSAKSVLFLGKCSGDTLNLRKDGR